MRSVLLTLADGGRRQIALSRLLELLEPADRRLVEEGHVPADVAGAMRLGARSRGEWALHAFLVRASEGAGFAVRARIPAQARRPRCFAPDARASR